MAIKIVGSTVIDNNENLSIKGYAEVTQYVSGSDFKIGNDIVINNSRQLTNIANGSAALSLSSRDLTLQVGGTNQFTQDLAPAYSVKNMAKFSSTAGATQHLFDVSNATTVTAEYHGNTGHGIGSSKLARSNSDGTLNPFGSHWKMVSLCSGEESGVEDMVYGPSGDTPYGPVGVDGEGIMVCQSNANFDIRLEIMD